MIYGQKVRYFQSLDVTQKGPMAFIVSKFSDLPVFSRNKDSEIAISYKFNPRLQYTQNTLNIHFDTKAGISPYIIFDLRSFKILPTKYSISLLAGFTPPTEWTLSGSDTGNPENDNEWYLLSPVPHNLSICPEIPQLSKEPHLCLESVQLEYQCDHQNEKWYRFTMLKYLRTRVVDFGNSQNHYFRLQKLELFGFLSGHVTCDNHRITLSFLKYLNIYVLFLQ